MKTHELYRITERGVRALYYSKMKTPALFGLVQLGVKRLYQSKLAAIAARKDSGGKLSKEAV